VNPRDDLASLLAEQYSWIHTSAVAFDAGERSEAKRIASAIRTLIHQGAKPMSLLGQMKLRDSMTWLSTIDMSSTNRSGLWEYDDQKPGREATRRLPTFECDFETWWHGSIYPSSADTLSRAFFVTNLTNMDGGSHVDPKPPAHYVRISREGLLQPTRVNSAGARYRDKSDPTPSVVRTIAGEVLKSLDLADW
jgi:hypothetical protein